VIAQGIELQRRWIREIKVRVEQERGGRLAKLDELAFHIKQLEQLTLANAAHLEETLRVHALWAAIRRLHRAIDAPVRTPFRDDLRRLRHIATAAAGATATSIESVEGKEELEEAAPRDPLLSAVLESLDASDTPDIGVEPFGDLVSWFTSSVAPRVSRVALVPAEDEGGAGVLAHLASGILSRLQFHRTGLVPGKDVQSVLARAEWYLNEKDLDSATRELNQLKGTARVLLRDWLDAARSRLEIQQALEVRPAPENEHGNLTSEYVEVGIRSAGHGGIYACCEIDQKSKKRTLESVNTYMWAMESTLQQSHEIGTSHAENTLWKV
jgi:MICOS complex subunit MIC60